MMNICYESSKGVKLNLLSGFYRLQTGDLFDYEWDYNSKETVFNGGNITEFRKGVSKKRLLLGVLGRNKAEYYNALNRLYEIAEYDLLNMSPGKLWIGEHYLTCYIMSSRKTEWEYNAEVLDNEIEVLSEYPFWCKEVSYRFKPSTDELVNAELDKEVAEFVKNSTTKKEFPFDYPFEFKNNYKKREFQPMFEFPFDFKNERTAGKFRNEHFTSCDFKMIIYGPCLNPRIFINNHLYEVIIMLTDGEYLFIDSRFNTVVKHANNGVVKSAYNNRNKESNLFEKIGTGQNIVKWSAFFGFDIILIQERGEPKWT